MTPIHLHSTAASRSEKNPGLANIKTYGKALFLMLFLMYAAAFFAFWWLELHELRQELFSTSRTINEQKGDVFPEDSSAIAQYPTGVVVLHKNEADQRTGFYEKNIAREDYLIYSDPGSSVIVAKEEGDVSREVSKFLIILLILYFGQIVALLGWWFYLKAELKTLFTVA